MIVVSGLIEVASESFETALAAARTMAAATREESGSSWVGVGGEFLVEVTSRTVQGRFLMLPSFGRRGSLFAQSSGYGPETV